MQQLREWEQLDAPEERVWLAAIIALGAAGCFATMLSPIAASGGETLIWVGLRAVLYVCFVALAAVGAFGLAPGGSQERSMFRPGPSGVRVAVAGAWLAPVVMYVALDSVWALLAAVPFGVSAAAILRRAFPANGEAGAQEAFPSLLFGTTQAPRNAVWTRSARFKLAALAAYGSAASAAAGYIPISVLFAAAGSLGFAWPRGLPESRRRPVRDDPRRHIAGQAWLGVACATVLTIGALHPKLGRAYGSWKAPAVAGDAAPSLSGQYSSVILLSEPKSSETLRTPGPSSLPARGQALHETVGIPFSGEYWFFYWPMSRPGTRAYVRRGDPTSFEYVSTDDSPMTMQARQALSTPLDTRCCSAIDVVLESNEARPGTVFLELILLQSGRERPVSQSLGALPLTTSSQAQDDPSRPAQPPFRFPIPEDSLVRTVNELAVSFHLDSSRSGRSAKLAIDRFELVP